MKIAHAMGLTLAAIALAAIGATVSLIGLVSMFGLAFLPIGAGLEAGKLISAAALHRAWLTLGWRTRYALTAIVVTLMILTSSGIYGFTLTRYLAHVAEITAPALERAAAADADIARQADKVADLAKQIEALDAAPAANFVSRIPPSRNARAIAAQAEADKQAAKQRHADEERRQTKRDGLSSRRDAETAELARLKGLRAQIGSQQKAAEAEIGPVKLVADIVGVDPGKVVAATVAAIYDALCVLLLLVAGHKASPVAAAPAKIEAPIEAPVVVEISAAVKRKPARKRLTPRQIAARKGHETKKRKALDAAIAAAVAANADKVVRVKRAK